MALGVVIVTKKSITWVTPRPIQKPRNEAMIACKKTIWKILLLLAPIALIIPNSLFFSRTLLYKVSPITTAPTKKLIATITANKQNTFTAEDLKERSVTELTALAKLAAPIATNKKKSPAYTGQGEVVNTEEEMPAPMVMPTMNWNEKEEIKS